MPKPRRQFPIDLSDAAVLIGLGGLGYGLWQISQPLMFIVVGCVIASLGLIGSLRRSMNGSAE